MNIDLIDKTINGRNVLKIILDWFDRFIVLIYNHSKDKDNEQHRNIILIRFISRNENEIVIPDTVDTQYQLIIIRKKYTRMFIYTKSLNKSQSYTITPIEIIPNTNKHNLDYFQQTHVIKKKRYHSISRFPNSNAINDVYLVGGTDQRLVRSFFKINYKDNQKSYERAENEIKAMKLLKDNPRFVQLVDYHHDKDNQIFHIITKYCDGGDLSQKYQHLTDQNETFQESDISSYISQLFNILLDLDKHGIVHCDIKPSNIFIDDNYNSTLMLGDFGCCKFIDKSNIAEYQDTKQYLLETNDYNMKCIDHEISYPSIFEMNTLINATRGSPGYISPEAMNRQYAQSCDIFSIGSTILKLLCCHQDDRNNHDLFKSNSEIIISHSRYSKQLIDFIHRLLDRSPKNRESLNQLLNQYIETVTNNHSITFNLDTTFQNTSVYVTDIKFGDKFNQPLKSNSLPPNLTSLSFGNKFDQPLIDVPPYSFKKLILHRFFNQIRPKGVLPESLKSLVFGKEFNQKLSVGVLPESLELLVFGNEFNQILSVVGVLPKSLESLEFGYKFNQILSVGVLPKSLKSLVFGVVFNQILSVGVLPESLESLVFGYGFNQKLSVGVLPESLKSLVFGGFNQILSVGVLPESLESLVFGGALNQILSVGVLPESLKSLVFGVEFNQILSVGVLPESLESLVFGNEFNQILSVGVLPKSLKSLEFGWEFNQILSVGVLPESLESLTMMRYAHRMERGVLPQQIKEICCNFNQPLDIGVLPSSLQRIDILDLRRKSNEVQILKLIQPLIIGIYDKDVMQRIPSNIKTIKITVGSKTTIFEAFILTNSHESLQFIQEFNPEYYSTQIKYSSFNSSINQISGEYIFGLILTDKSYLNSNLIDIYPSSPNKSDLINEYIIYIYRMKSAIKRNFLKFTGRLGFNRGQISGNNVPDEPEVIGPDLPKENLPKEPVEFERDEFDHRIQLFRSYLVSLSLTAVKDEINNETTTTTNNNNNISNSASNTSIVKSNSASNSSFNLSNIYIPNDLIHAIFCTLISNSNMLIDTSHINNNNNNNNRIYHRQPIEKQSNCSILSKAIPIMSGLSCAYISCTNTTTPEELVQQLFLQIPSDAATTAALMLKNNKRLNNINNSNNSNNYNCGSNNSSNNNLEQSLSLTKSLETPPLTRSRNESVGSSSSQQNQNSANTRQRTEANYKMVDILLVDDIDIAPMPTRYTLLQMMTYRKVAFKGITYNTPSSLSIIATASSLSNPNIISPTIEPLSPLMLDCFFINIRLYEQLRLPQIKLETDPLISTPESHYIVTPSRLHNLRQLLPKIYITHDIEQYMRTIIVNLRNHPLVTFGPSPRATPTLTSASKIVGMLSGQKFVTPTHILMIAAQVLNHRIFLSNPFPLEHQQHSPRDDDPLQNSPSGSPNSGTPSINVNNDSNASYHNDPFSSSSSIPTSMKIQKPTLSILSQATLLPPPPISIVDTSADLNIKSSVELSQMKRSTLSNQEFERDFDSFSVIKIILENLAPPL
ncbi:hypothetical protein PPL_12091 [Heterostelium album PN500]|uniref:magnesium chelatase n=1 Tax=Heterostelium pallidum (strain ATCC 26659 / Pp 5 / PN500) TaxID=670386 RepID=D3BLN8_HETP5|nr:hypothetical protein PPL_12091 [Heterostelium album PN500]EFA77489.1 hypothetical protein PPL_12091 [Heterostelium album PN500]|eukprot:XP_020429617.1 hypothetical protein PPL_12091 [Heterostelium album PN500]